MILPSSSLGKLGRYAMTRHLCGCDSVEVKINRDQGTFGAYYTINAGLLRDRYGTTLRMFAVTYVFLSVDSS